MAKKKTVEWEALKSGARKGPDGWWAAQYSTGWYFSRYVAAKDNGKQTDSYSKTSSTPDKHLGPFASFNTGLESWQKEK